MRVSRLSRSSSSMPLLYCLSPGQPPPFLRSSAQLPEAGGAGHPRYTANAITTTAILMRPTPVPSPTTEAERIRQVSSGVSVCPCLGGRLIERASGTSQRKWRRGWDAGRFAQLQVIRGSLWCGPYRLISCARRDEGRGSHTAERRGRWAIYSHRYRPPFHLAHLFLPPARRFQDPSGGCHRQPLQYQHGLLGHAVRIADTPPHPPPPQPLPPLL